MYCTNMSLHPLHVVLNNIINYVDPRASIYGKNINYSIKLNGKWRKRTLTLAECTRITQDLSV
jgi:hypothetical protein